MQQTKHLIKKAKGPSRIPNLVKLTILNGHCDLQLIKLAILIWHLIKSTILMWLLNLQVYLPKVLTKCKFIVNKP